MLRILEQAVCPRIRKELSGLCSAIEHKAYPRIYKELGRLTAPFSNEEACLLLGEALDSGLKADVFEAVLANSPPVPELISTYYQERMIALDDYEPDVMDGSPLETAAFLDRADVLSMLLERGADPNLEHAADYSPLEAAVKGDAVSSVELLMQQPELDTDWTDELLREWARPRASLEKLELCQRAMAPRFTGWVRLSGWPLPVPEPMTVRIIVKARNWPLLECFCRERGPVSTEDGQRIIRTLGEEAVNALCECPPQREESECVLAAAMDALLGSCPNLLREEDECQELLSCFLAFGEKAQARLRPWVESLSGRRIATGWRDWRFGGYADIPDLWQRLMPHGPTLVIDRWDREWVDLFMVTSQQSAEALGHVLDVCPIRGEGRKGELSPLARTVLQIGGLSFVLSLLHRSDGLLATEDPDALLEYVLEGGCLGHDRGQNGFMAEKKKALSSAPAARTPEQTRRLAEKLLIMQNLCS